MKVHLSYFKLNGESIEGHPIIDKLLYLKQVLQKLKPVYKKLDFQISRLVSLAGKEASEINLNNQEDVLLMKPNLALEDLVDAEKGDSDIDDDAEDANRKLSSKVRDRIAKKVDRAMESGYGEMEKSQKREFIAAIRQKREIANKEQKKKDQFSDFKKRRLLESKFVRDMDDELHERPIETEKRANIKGIYDPMQEKRQ